MSNGIPVIDPPGQPAGLPSGVGRLLNAEFPGSTRLTGGLLGPEASWFTFLVSIAAIVALHFTYRKAKWPVPEED